MRVDKSFIISLVVIIILLSLLSLNDKSLVVIGNKKILSEIDHLLLPLGSKNITESDFNALKNMVRKDEYATGEVNDIILLTKYKEYSHIGHSLGFLYEYVKTGEEPLCPGHALSHYYVFLRHGEDDTAKDNLEEAEEGFEEWKKDMSHKGAAYLVENNYTYSSSLIAKYLDKIDNGDNVIGDDDLSNLNDVVCA